MFAMLDGGITIVLSWAIFKWAGLVLFILSVVAFFAGDLPDNQGSSFGNGLRWIVWPLMLLWLLVFFIRGLFFS